MYLRRNTRTLLILSVLTAFFTGFFPALTGGEVLEKITHSMGKVQTVYADFVQEKRLKNFAFPMKITGVMASDHKQGRLAWRVKTPLQYNCIIDNEKLTQWDADSGKVHTLRTAQNRALQMLTETLRTLFSGNVEKMLKDFTILKEENPLTLYPRKGRIFQNHLTKITLYFTPDLTQLTGITMVEKNSDETRIRFLNRKINAKLPDHVWIVKGTP